MRTILKFSLVLLISTISILNSFGKNNRIDTDPITFTEKVTTLSITIDPPVSETDVRYYYFPNIQAYYDTKLGLFIFRQNRVWVTSEYMNFNSRGYSKNNDMYVKLRGLTSGEPYELLKEHIQKYPADFSSKPKRSLLATTN